jgi:hypothetical protein
MRPPPIGVWRLPIPLPLAVVVTGCATLSHRWSREVELRQAGRYIFAVLGTTLATLLVAGAMLAARGLEREPPGQRELGISIVQVSQQIALSVN